MILTLIKAPPIAFKASSMQNEVICWDEPKFKAFNIEKGLFQVELFPPSFIGSLSLPQQPNSPIHSIYSFNLELSHRHRATCKETGALAYLVLLNGGADMCQMATQEGAWKAKQESQNYVE